MKKFAVLVMILALCAPVIAHAVEEVNVYNWEDYIAPEALKLFEQETGIKINYMRFTTNEDMLVQVRADPTNYDVIFPSDYIIERLISEDLLEPLDWANIPNAAHTLDWLRAPSYDPEGVYSVPYMWGTVGILYNPDMVDEEIDSWAQMFDVKYKRNVFMMRSIRDTIGATLKMLGYSVNTRDPEQLDAAKQALIRQKADGIVKGYLLDETKDKMISGEAAMALMYSGDALYSIAENEELVYVVPSEGSNIWVDGMCVPKGSANKEAAQAFIDFMCRPDIARMNMDYIYYSTPIQQVVDEMDDDERDDATLNPTQDIIDRCEFYQDISEYVGLYDQIWMEILS